MGELQRNRHWIRGTGLVSIVIGVGMLGILPLGGATFLAGSSTSDSVRPNIIATCAAGSGPYFPAYDPVNHAVYVPNYASGNITVLKRTCSIAGTIHLPTGASPVAVAFDPANNDVYVTDDSLNQVYVISGQTIVATISGTQLPSPWAITWDPGDSMILVSNDYGAYDVVGIQGTTIVGTIGVGSFPTALCFDPFYNVVLVVNRFSDNVTLLNAYSPLSPVVGTVAVGSNPSSCAYDPADSEDYVVNYGSNNVSVISGSGGVIGSVTVGSLPRGIAWDQATLQIMVGNTQKGGVSLISGTTFIGTVGAGAKNSEGLVYDWQNNYVYVTSYTGNDLVAIT
jgi:YVTN family beta-propeller protein